VRGANPSILQYLAPRAGLEPTTSWLTAKRSTIELPRNNLKRPELGSHGYSLHAELFPYRSIEGNHT
jgi:hypothetical protein